MTKTTVPEVLAVLDRAPWFSFSEGKIGVTIEREGDWFLLAVAVSETGVPQITRHATLTDTFVRANRVIGYELFQS